MMPHSGSGTIDKQELRKALGSYGLRVNLSQATAILDRYADSNGNLDEERFTKLVEESVEASQTQKKV